MQPWISTYNASLHGPSMSLYEDNCIYGAQFAALNLTLISILQVVWVPFSTKPIFVGVIGLNRSPLM